MSEQSTSGTYRHCPTCSQVVETEEVGTSRHIETGRPVPQLECSNCGAVGDDAEFEQPLRTERESHHYNVAVQRQITNQGKVEFSASYSNRTHYDDTDYVNEGISLSLFIKDEQVTRMVYECLREMFEDRYVDTET